MHHRLMGTRIAHCVVLAMGMSPASACAQVVRGIVVDGAERPVSGVVVSLLDSTKAVVARSLSSERGEYRVVAPHSGTYYLRTLRIGFQPTESAARVFTTGSVSDERIVLDGIRVSLATVRVVERSVCGRGASGDAASIFAAWDQAMTSIAATTLSSSGSGLTATTMMIERVLDANGRSVREQSIRMRTDIVAQPWRSLPPDMLRQRGYTSIDASQWTTYYAPGLEVLVSPLFLEDHCLRLVASRDNSEIGVAFEPTPQRRRLSEIAGTLWLTRGDAELRRLDFTFTDVPAGAEPFAAGGAMNFKTLRGGVVVISSWEIRMPQLEKDSPRATRLRVAAIRSTGGQVVVMRRNADTLFKRPTLAVTGVVLDSATGAPSARATVSLVGTTHRSTADEVGRFSIADVLPGEYDLAVRTPSLDSIRASSQVPIVVAEGLAPLRIKTPTATQLSAVLCGTALSGATGRGKGAILGSVRNAIDTTMLGGVRVVADWSDYEANSGASLRVLNHRLETQTDSLGAYRLCGVPIETPLSIRAVPSSGRSAVRNERLSANERFATALLMVDPGKTSIAALRGVVVADSSNRPLADAEVAMPALGLATRSNARGEFQLPEVPAGTHELVVRRIGFGAVSSPITIAANDDEERRVVMRPLTVLDSVSVLATRIDPRLRDFEENRRVGLGHFLSRDEIERQSGRRIGDIMSMIPGAGLARGTSGAWLLSKRFTISLSCATSPQTCTSIWKPNALEKSRGMVAGCYSQVYLDSQLLNPSNPTEPFDLNSIVTDQIEAVEWYASPAQTPARYAKLNSPCGVLVIHTRR